MTFDVEKNGYSTGDKTSFAWSSARQRWPVIITTAIDDVYRTVHAETDPEVVKEGKQILESLANLKYQVQHDRALTPIPDDGYPDVALYNEELAKLSPATWLNVPWLYSECHLYRQVSSPSDDFSSTLLLRTLVPSSQTHHGLTHKHILHPNPALEDVRPLPPPKISTFRSSRAAVLELASRYRTLVGEIRAGGTISDDAERLMFTEMLEVCLWGNATDLSLLTTLTYDDIQKLQGSEARKAAENNILANDTAAAFAVLRRARDEGKAERRVDIVLDNSGFELYVDLILAGYLLSSGLATHVVLHPKSIPCPFTRPLRRRDPPEQDPAPLADADAENLAFLFEQWSGFHAEGQVILRPNRFWTHGGSFWRLPTEAPELLEDLKASELVIFKGDLNYRKLTADVSCLGPHNSFVTALGPLGPGAGVNILSLRTCKADVVVGLEPGVDEELRAKEGGGGDSGERRWAWNGKWAVISFSPRN
ncbi:unnamed protein product [Parascedosporium putredinis]|uniref:Sugar phosphate phosphatase n=1 Tax=Parascedosporium putredinis TaxID=1442378 RepID=A0A9P1GZT2_9PEZI|nr:unnamed protein product [Parascedosporium putredinis]CAI7991139.1 unnamed protein product [Parascedosporium putredinis]